MKPNSASPGSSSGSTSFLFDFPGFQQRANIGGLDGLRALAIMAVLLHHVMVGQDVGWINTLHENGRYGVHLFFVISGFLICTLFLREERDTGRISLPRFYGRRMLRLMPLYYAVLCLYVVLVLVVRQYTPANQQMFMEKLPSFWFYYSNWLPGPPAGPFFCAWSLAVEEQFYLLFGLMIFLLPRQMVVWTVAVALVTKVALVAGSGPVDTSSVLRIVFSYQEAILWGVLLAFGLNQRSFYERTCRVLGRSGVATLIGLGLAAWLAMHRMHAQGSWDAQLGYLLMTLLVAAVAIRMRVGFLSARFLIHLGKISYGIYLLHMIVFSVAKKLPGGKSPWICFILTTMGSVFAASIAYRYFEAPIIRWYKERLAPVAAGPKAGSAPPIVAGASQPVG